MGFYRSALSTLNNGQYTELVVVDGMDISIDNYSYESLLPSSFNGTVSIGNKATNCSHMFSYCRNFNQPITIPNSVTNCSYMFYYCNSFNQPITIPNSVTICSGMFYYCRNFNQPITIPDSVTSCSDMFSGCSNFNQPITIPDSVTSCYWMFSYCSNFNQPIDFKGTAYRSLNISRMLYQKNNSKRVNIRFNNKLNSIFNKTTTNSIVGANIMWTAMINGFYNATYNVYCYYNYAG